MLLGCLNREDIFNLNFALIINVLTENDRIFVHIRDLTQSSTEALKNQTNISSFIFRSLTTDNKIISKKESMNARQLGPRVIP